jgi:hypothetical protein
MRIPILLLAAISLAGCAHGGRPDASASTKTQAAEDAARLEAALKGRVAGPAQDCVDQRYFDHQESFGRSTIVFSGGPGDVVYVNRPPVACVGLDVGRAIKTRTPTIRLCRGDVVTVFDPTSGMSVGGCSLGEFVPYRPAAVAQAK